MLVVSSKSNLGCEAGCGLRFYARIMLGSFSDHSRIVPALEMTFHLFLDIFFEILQCNFAWQAQYLARLARDTCCSAHCKWRFICDEDYVCESFCVAGAVLGEVQVLLFVVGAVFGEVQVSLFVAGAVLGEVQVLLFVVGAVFGEVQVLLFVAGAALGECLNVRLGAKRCIFQNRKCSWWARKVTSVARRVAVCVFMLGSCSDHSRIVPALEMTFHLFLDIFFEILQCNFAWQAQYLARLARDTCCSAHWKWRFICDED